MQISGATRRNWDRLSVTNTGDRLTKRANKTNSKKRIVPYEYITDTANLPAVLQIADVIISNGYDVSSAMFSVLLNRFDALGISEHRNVKAFIRSYSNLSVICGIMSMKLPDNECDFPGLIYQSLYIEGDKNKRGLYYTPPDVAAGLSAGLDFSCGQTILDPCCGSGSFLLGTTAKDPLQLYGADSDPIAVMICKANLIMRFKDYDFDPQIYHMDFINDNNHGLKSMRFNYVSTNPPWGAVTNKSGETFEMFLNGSLKMLSDGGVLNVLLPQSVLNVKAHRVIRHHILENYSLAGIKMFPAMFSGVTTQVCALKVVNSRDINTVVIEEDGREYTACTDIYMKSRNRVYMRVDEDDTAILDILESHGKHSISNSRWALGIVTGNNAALLFDAPTDGTEPIYTGKEVSPYKLLPPEKHIVYNRDTFQQAAGDEMYRADEKLVYKFISKRPVFAYDNTGALLLNSANMLIPKIPGMSIKTVMLFLNSELFAFAYIKKFGEPKILQGNLCDMPFPEISGEDDTSFRTIADRIIRGDISAADDANAAAYAYYGLTVRQIEHVKKELKRL